jgi:hypothetical protein
VLAAALLFSVVTLPAPAHAVTVVAFADPALESAARSALAKPSGDITDVDMATLTSLDATSKGIADLEGLQYATGLTHLDLSGNRITTITALAVLSPQTVDVSHNWLDVSAGSAARTVIDGWLDHGGSVEYEPQGHATTCVLTTTSKTIGYATRTTIAGALSDSETASLVAGCVVSLQSSSNGTTFKDAGVASSTTAAGTFTFTVAPTTRTYYRVSFAGSGFRYLGSASRAVCFTPGVYLTAPTGPAVAYRYRPFLSGAYIKPRHAGGTSPVRFLCYRYQKLANGKYGWVQRASMPAKAADYSVFTKVTAALSLPYPGKWCVRAYHPADAENAATYSSYRYFYVEDGRIEAAIAWARARMGQHGWDHYCLRFACDSYASGAGASVHRYATARIAADALRAASRPSANAPRGAFVFYHSWHGTVDLGHVGISLGNGTMISDNGAEGVCIKPIIYGLRYIGWAAPPVSPRITDWD